MANSIKPKGRTLALLRNASALRGQEETKRLMQQGNYHCSVKSVSRSQGRSATAAAAYRAGEEIADERTGEIHDYTRKQGVIHAEIVAPEGVSIDRKSLWNQAESAEKRKDAKVAREWELALPHELDRKEQIALAMEFAGKLVERYGVAVDVCIHEPHREGDQRNTHAHLLTTTRQITPEGLTSKTRELDSPKTSGAEVDHMREAWADCCNRAYARAGLNIYTDHRTLEAQGIDRSPTKHLGPTATEIERNGGVSELGEYNREIKAQQAEIEKLQKELAFVTQLVQQLERQTEEKTTPESNQKYEMKKTRREYNVQTTKRAIEFIQNEPNINKVKKLFFVVQSDATKKDLETEIKKQFEYHQAEQRQEDCKNVVNDTTYQEKRIAVKIENLGMIARAKYRLGKHELCQQERDTAKRKEKAHIEFTKAQREFSEIKTHLSSPASEVYQEVRTHNLNAQEAQKTYEQLTEHYNSRIAKEVESQKQEREQKRGVDIER